MKKYWILVLAATVAAGTLTTFSPAQADHKHRKGCHSGRYEDSRHYSRYDRGYDYDGYDYDRRYGYDSRFYHRRQAALQNLLWGEPAYAYHWAGRFRQDVWGQRPLPPGLRRRLLRGQVLPPGVLQQVVVAPTSIYGYLGMPYQPNYRIGAVGRNVILYDIATGILQEILYNGA